MHQKKFFFFFPASKNSSFTPHAPTSMMVHHFWTHGPAAQSKRLERVTNNPILVHTPDVDLFPLVVQVLAHAIVCEILDQSEVGK